MKIRNRLLVFILSSVLAVVTSMIVLGYFSGRRSLIKEITSNAVTLLDKHRISLDTELAKYADIARDESVVVSTLFATLNREDLDRFLKAFVQENPDIYGSTIAFLPGAFEEKEELFAPYYYRGVKGIEYSNLAEPSYDYVNKEWFKGPLSTGQPAWSPPYIDVGGGNVAMTTYSYPFSFNGKPLGVSTVDISLKELTDEISAIKVAESGFAFLIDKQGRFLSMRRGEESLRRTLFDAAKEFKNDKLEELAVEMTEGRSGLVSIFNPLINKQSWVAFGPISSTGWSLAMVFPEDELMAELRTLHRNSIAIALAGVLFILAAVYFISLKITRPVIALSESVRKVAGGDFDTKIDFSGTNDEIGVLSSAFIDMTASLLHSFSRLNEEKEQFKVAFSQMSDGLVILNKECGVVQFNKKAGDLLQLPCPGNLHEHLLAIFDGDFPEKCEISTGARVFKISRRETKEAQNQLHLECSITPINGDDGELKEFVLSIKDITEQESEERSKREFLSLMSHKLFTPLSVLQGKLMLMKDGLLGPMDEKQSKTVASMATQTAKLNDLIESLVNFVSMEGSKFDMTREPIDLVAALNDMAEKSRSWYTERAPEINVSVEENASGLSFNKKLFDVMIRQLIENGIKFNLSSPPKVGVSCTKRDGKFVISVSDNGVGIPPEYNDKIFEKFFQIEKYYTGNVEGVGLGLAYVKKIVEAFGGTISVSSEVGKGSTFVVTL